MQLLSSGMVCSSGGADPEAFPGQAIIDVGRVAVGLGSAPGDLPAAVLIERDAGAALEFLEPALHLLSRDVGQRRQGEEMAVIDIVSVKASAADKSPGSSATGSWSIANQYRRPFPPGEQPASASSSGRQKSLTKVARRCRCRPAVRRTKTTFLRARRAARISASASMAAVPSTGCWS